MPELTVKALAEFAEKPIADQMRILAEQKRPLAGAAQFKTHYYNPTRLAIRAFYARNNSPNILQLASSRVQTGGGPDHKRDHNLRAIRDFGSHEALTSRVLRPVKPTTYVIKQNNVDIRLHPDLEAYDGTSRKFILINYSLTAVEPDLVRRTLELMYWLLDSYGLQLRPVDCEIIDLKSGLLYTNNRSPRSTIIRNADQNLLVINQLWPII